MFALVLAVSAVLELQQRLPTLEESIPTTTSAAKAVVERMEANPNAVIEIPRQWCWGFYEEMVGRAGGLAQIGHEDISQPEDIVLFAIRSWEHLGCRAIELVRDWQAEGKLVIAIGSKAGCPADFKPNFFLDNGAPDGTRQHACMNAIINAVIGWTFCLEYAAAWSQKGRFPAVWRTVAGDDCWAVNGGIFSPDGRVRFYACEKKIPAGMYANIYLNRFARRLSDLGSIYTAEQIDSAATIIADRLAVGKRAAFAGIGHLIIYEACEDLRSPMFGFRATSGFRKKSFSAALGKGDILVWVGYTSPSSRWADYLTPIREAGIELIYSAAPTLPANPVPEGTLAVIAQHWLLPDAEVAIPVPPGMMAPLSEVDRCVIVRLLDHAVAKKLSDRGVSIPKTQPRDQIATAALQKEFGPSFPPRLPCESKPSFCGYARWEQWGLDRVLVEKGGRWGLADSKGRILAPIRYENLRIASDQLLASQIGEKYGVVDRNGKEVIVPSLQAVLPPWKWLQVKIAFMKDGKFGVLDPVTGAIVKEATSPKYPGEPVAPKKVPVDKSAWDRFFIP